jgi:hypothetical protein
MKNMTQITDAISAVRAAASSAGNMSGNTDSALYLIEKCGAIEETIRNLEWAESNHRDAGYKIKAAIDAVKKLNHNKPS